MEKVLSDAPAGGWTHIVGPDYEASYLDTPVLRQRSLALSPRQRRPAVRKLVTPDGRSYKLLYVPVGNPKIRDMLPVIRTLQNETFVPRLLWSDAHSLLFEFIEGEFPSLKSDRFSADLGATLARLHAYRYSSISSLRYRMEFAYNLSSVRRHDLISDEQARLARSLHAATRPSSLRRSIDYFDINRTNFIYDHKGGLKLIDAGSFRRNRPTGQFSIGSPYFASLNQAVFWEAYRGAGGASFPFENRNYLHLFHVVMTAGQQARKFARQSDKTSDEAARQWQRCVKSRDGLIEFLDAMV